MFTIKPKPKVSKNAILKKCPDCGRLIPIWDIKYSGICRWCADYYAHRPVLA